MIDKSFNSAYDREFTVWKGIMFVTYFEIDLKHFDSIYIYRIIFFKHIQPILTMCNAFIWI